MKKPSPYLTFAGAIPFVACALLILVGIDTIPMLGASVYVLSTYGLIIASFMAGAQWGNHLSLNDGDMWSVGLPILSNVITIVLWFGFLILPTLGFMWLLILGFLSLLMIDYGLYRAHIIDATYFKVRKYVTLIVVLALALSASQL